MGNPFDWIWALLPIFLGSALFFWVYNIQSRIENVEKRLEELMNRED